MNEVVKAAGCRSISLVLTVLLLTISGVASFAQESSVREAAIKSGKEIFDVNCATCHGLDGKGETPLAQLIGNRAADLTILSKKNDGAFPFFTVLEVIDGRYDLVAHGMKGMPIWGRVFYDKDDPNRAHGRIFDVTMFLESIQER